jgi:type I restriction enzyme M protein
MKADGKSLDQKRNLIVDESIFEDFAFATDLSAEKLSQLAKAHENFNLPQVLDHYRYLKSDYFLKMHDKDGSTFEVHDIPQNLGFNHFLDGTCTHDFTDRTSQSFLVPVQEIKDNDWDLSINRYKEIVYEEVEYDAPEVILERIEKLNNERMAINQELFKSL